MALLYSKAEAGRGGQGPRRGAAATAHVSFCRCSACHQRMRMGLQMVASDPDFDDYDMDDELEFPLPLAGDGDGEDLLCDHGEHFQVDTVELVEAGPCPGRGQSFEEFTHGLVVQTV